jgi:hypothetical protein
MPENDRPSFDDLDACPKCALPWENSAWGGRCPKCGLMRDQTPRPPRDAAAHWSAQPTPTVARAFGWWKDIEQFDANEIERVFCAPGNQLQHPLILQLTRVARETLQVEKMHEAARRRMLDKLTTLAGKGDAEVLALPVDQAIGLLSPAAVGVRTGPERQRLDPLTIPDQCLAAAAAAAEAAEADRRYWDGEERRNAVQRALCRLRDHTRACPMNRAAPVFGGTVAGSPA